MDNGDLESGTVGQLTKFIRLRRNVFNKVDAAIARIESRSAISKNVLHIGPPSGTGIAKNNMLVHKFGRTTGYRTGEVKSVDTDVKVEYDLGVLLFRSQIIIKSTNRKKFSDSGDSGSLILEKDSNQAIGLLFAGSSSHTIANHLRDVFKALRIELA